MPMGMRAKKSTRPNELPWGVFKMSLLERKAKFLACPSALGSLTNTKAAVITRWSSR